MYVILNFSVHMQIKIVFSCFSMIPSALGSDESLTYADHLLAPLYKVSEGFAGKSLVVCVNIPVLVLFIICFQHIGEVHTYSV
jgi:hypothetical protein